ncbi:hypothetical protein FRB91_002265 [Serendipita sp. 411]|nr:hypothetical protein FRB91_002265 [Serendipita sp. 411]
MGYSSWKAKLRALVKDPSGSLGTLVNRAVWGVEPPSEKMGERPTSPDCYAHELDSIVTDSVAVHFLYDVNLPPPRPNISVQHPRTTSNDSGERLGYRWTRFICMSDTHCNTFEVPEGGRPFAPW